MADDTTSPTVTTNDPKPQPIIDADIFAPARHEPQYNYNTGEFK